MVMIEKKKIIILISIIIILFIFVNSSYASEIKGICLVDIYETEETIISWDIKIVGNRAYVAFWDSSMGLYSGGLDIFDITNPFEPVLIKRFTYTMPPTQYTHGIKALAIKGNHVYIANWAGGLCVVDITEEEEPYIIGTYTEGCGGYGTAMHEMVIDGDYLYITWDTKYGLGIFDISDPSDIKKISNYGGISYTRGIVKKDNYVFITTYYGAYVRIFDVSDVYNPQLVANISTPGVAWYLDISIVGNLLIIADSRDTYGLKIYDITDPENPVFKGKYATTSMGYGWLIDVSAKDKYAYTVFEYGVAIFNVENPSNPVLLFKEKIAEDSLYRKLDVGDNFFYVTGLYGDELYIIGVAYNIGTLEWEGSKGYEDDGVAIIEGEYVFKVKYINADNTAPFVRQLWIDLNDNGSYEEEEKIDMLEEDSSDDNYADGKVYQKSLSISYAGDGEIKYKFYFQECAGEVGGIASVEQTFCFLQLIYPENNTIIYDITPTFKWEIPVEPNDEILHFKIEITDDPGFSYSLYTFESKIDSAGFIPIPPIQDEIGNQFYTMLKSLEYNKTYFWKVSAWDGDEYYISSPVWKFIIQQ